MAKTELEAMYPSKNNALGMARRVARVDESEGWDVDQTEILVEKAGTYLLATASGCSCWDGDWEVTRYDSLRELFDDIGLAGTSERKYNPSFAAQEDLFQQTKRTVGLPGVTLDV